MIRIKLSGMVNKLLHRQNKKTPKQQILDELTVLRIKRERIQVMLSRGELSITSQTKMSSYVSAALATIPTLI